MDAVERRKASSSDGSRTAPVIPDQLDAISATNAEEREFNELRRELPRAEDISAASEILFKYMRRMVPISSLTLYVPSNETNELVVAASNGIGAQAIQGIRVPIGERISGWAFAHAQVVMNSDPTLELGPVARTFPCRSDTRLPFPSSTGKSSPCSLSTVMNPSNETTVASSRIVRHSFSPQSHCRLQRDLSRPILGSLSLAVNREFTEVSSHPGDWRFEFFR